MNVEPRPALPGMPTPVHKMTCTKDAGNFLKGKMYDCRIQYMRGKIYEGSANRPDTRVMVFENFCPRDREHGYHVFTNFAEINKHFDE